MRVVVQRVKAASVEVNHHLVSSIKQGLLIYLGMHATDQKSDADYLLDKILGLRIFEDDSGKMNLSVVQAGGGLLIVSQFTLYGDCRKGKRPSFIDAAPPPVAIPLYEAFINGVKALGIPVATGRFGADMKVELVNDGPVTLIVDSK